MFCGAVIAVVFLKGSVLENTSYLTQLLNGIVLNGILSILPHPNFKWNSPI
jgi:hypothetical protein